MLSGLDDKEKVAACWEAIEEELRGFEGPCELIFGGETK